MNWILFDEKKPSTSGWKIVNTKSGVGVGEYDAVNHIFKNLIVGFVHGNIGEVTHWMPLPEPPTDS